MNKIKQTTEVNYVNPSVKDCIIISKLFERLQQELDYARAYEAYYAMSEEQRKEYNFPYKPDTSSSLEDIESFISVLEDAGFVNAAKSQNVLQKKSC